ncbi:MAG: PqqD family protein [Clostridia bacterium]|nr:PqqD family protein [Clostridia bacterium]
MKLNGKFVLRQVAGNWVVLPLSDATVNFNGMIKLNESGVMLWRLLEQGKDREALADMLTTVYDVSREIALEDVDEFLNKLGRAGCIDLQ